MAGMGVGEMMLLSAAIGGGTSAATGQDPLKGALLGALGGAASAGLGGLLSGAGGAAGAGAGTIAGGSGLAAPGLTAAGSAGAGALGSAGASGIATLPTAASALTPAAGALAPAAATAPLAVPAAASAAPGITALGASAPINPALIEQAAQASQLGAASPALPGLAQSFAPNYSLLPPQAGGAASTPLGAQAIERAAGLTSPATTPGFFDDPKAWWKSLPPEKKLLYGGTGLGALALMGGRGKIPGQEPYTGPLSRFRYDPDVYMPSLPGPRFASGGIADLGGSDLGSYSDGGQLLAGDGDGMSDDIPASISGKQPARLADGEFVVPADVVSGLGNGSTDAGARELYSMMSRVRKQRTGTEKQGRQIEPRKVVPA